MVEGFKSGCLCYLLAEMHQFFCFAQHPPDKVVVEDQYEQMRVENNTIFVQKALYERCEEAPLFFATMVLHDWYHNVGQGIVGLTFVETFRNAFDERTMLLIDVNVDLAIYNFLQNTLGLNFPIYCQQVLFKGKNIFPNRELRIPKFERFLGSIWSIAHSERTGETAIFFPSLHHMFDEGETAHVIYLVLHNGIIKVRQVDIFRADFLPVVKGFTDAQVSESDFISAIEHLCSYLPQSID